MPILRARQVRSASHSFHLYVRVGRLLTGFHSPPLLLADTGFNLQLLLSFLL